MAWATRASIAPLKNSRSCVAIERVGRRGGDEFSRVPAHRASFVSRTDQSGGKPVGDRDGAIDRSDGAHAGFAIGVGVLSARLNEFVDSKQTLVAAIGTDKQEQVRLYVRGGSGRALFLTIEKAVGDFEVRVQREIPLESMTYEAWMAQARWQLLVVDSLGAILCIVLTRSVSLPTPLARSAGAYPTLVCGQVSRSYGSAARC